MSDRIGMQFPVRSRLVWLLFGIGVGLMLALAGAFVAASLLVAQTSTPVPQPGAALTNTPQPTVTTPPPTAQPTLSPDDLFDVVLLQETFTNPQVSSLRASENAGAAYRFEDAAYLIQVKKPNYIVWSPFSGYYADVAVEVDVTFEPGAGDTAAGVLFRFQDERNYAFFNISADGHYALDAHRNGQWSPVVDWTRLTEMRPYGEANRLRIEMVGDQISLYVNGVLLDQVSDEGVREGRMALGVNTFERDSATVRFDNLTVWGYNPPEPTNTR